jgi:O-antigen/teichoic acid export membrane protein
MVYDLMRLKLLKFHATTTKLTKRLRSKMFTYGSFIYGGGLFGIIADNVDTFLIAGISGLSSTGVFTVAAYISTILEVPRRTISGVATPILAQSWKNKDYANIQYLYEKTSLNQLIFGITIFLGVWLNIDDLFSFLPPAYAAGKYVVLIMCFARILDLGTGINGEMLTTSNMWRFSFFTQVIFIGLSIPTNYFLISRFGIIGSAYSNLIAYTAFNSIRFIYIYRKFKMQPFSINTLYVFLLGIAAYLFIVNIPLTNIRIVDIIIRGTLVLLCMGIPVLKFKLSEDIYILWHQILNRIKK